jgi:DNA polymerase III delta prime subunit
MRRIKLVFTRDVEIDFSDREKALKQIYEVSEKGTSYPLIIYGPEGCGKTSLLKQAVEIFREQGFETFYINPLQRDFIAHTDVQDLIKRFVETLPEAVGVAQLKLASLAIFVVRELLTRWRRRKIAVLIDDVFQAVGLDKAETYVKELLGLIEHPPASYDNIVAIMATSEGVTRERIGRHRWAILRPIWNMSREGFEELLEKIPGAKPSTDDLWMITGGNPDALRRLYQANWEINSVVKDVITSRKLEALISSLNDEEKNWLIEAMKDPDTLFVRERLGLLKRLVEANLMIDTLPERTYDEWIDQPPPERELEIGVGRYVAWQTPLYREAVNRLLNR